MINWASQVVLVVKNLPANAGDMGSIPGLGVPPAVEKSIPFQYSCLEKSMGRGAWWATVHGAAKSWTQLNTHTHAHNQLVFLPEYKGDSIEKFTVIHHINRLTEKNNYPNAEKAFCKV